MNPSRAKRILKHAERLLPSGFREMHKALDIVHRVSLRLRLLIPKMERAPGGLDIQNSLDWSEAVRAALECLEPFRSYKPATKVLNSLEVNLYEIRSMTDRGPF